MPQRNRPSLRKAMPQRNRPSLRVAGAAHNAEAEVR
jgi:hypothetical protein